MFRTRLNASKKKRIGRVAGCILSENKKGGRCKPPFRQLTPQNQNTVEVAFRRPREANIFICDLRMQVGCQATGQQGFPLMRLKQWELGSGNSSWLQGEQQKPYKISQMNSPLSPFFGRR